MYLSNLIHQDITIHDRVCQSKLHKMANFVQIRRARSRVGRATEMPPKEGLTLWLRIKASAKKGSASRQIGCDYILR